MNDRASVILAHYFGLPVEVIGRVESFCVIRFRGRIHLVFSRELKQAA